MMGRAETGDGAGSRRERPRHQVIQEAEHAHTDLITAALLCADGDIDGPGIHCSETRRE
jgi:hypothetical protein